MLNAFNKRFFVGTFSALYMMHFWEENAMKTVLTNLHDSYYYSIILFCIVAMVNQVLLITMVIIAMVNQVLLTGIVVWLSSSLILPLFEN